MAQILVVDDDQDILIAAKLLLKKHFTLVKTCHQPQLIPSLMAEHSFDAILLDMNFSPGESSGQQGFDWLERILTLDRQASVVMITAHGDLNLAVDAMKAGATDFVSKPWQNEKLVATLTSAAKLGQSRRQTQQLKQQQQAIFSHEQHQEQPLLGNSPAIMPILNVIDKCAPTDANVLILGENGTGKELVARRIYQKSLRDNQPFIAIDLGAVAENLFESELFGHKKGAFTGAMQDRNGLLVAAQGGTVFLDEIANIPLHLQAKLLTVLEQRRVTPLGSTQSIELDIRVIAATNVNRRELSDANKFRQDLLFRLNTVELLLPPLRERQEDIIPIASYYLAHYGKKYRKDGQTFSPSAINAMSCYTWPGNIRSLRHSVERAVILSESHLITEHDLQLSNDHISTASVSAQKTESEQENNEQTFNLEHIERQTIANALSHFGYNVSKAATALGLTRASLYRRMEKYDL